MHLIRTIGPKRGFTSLDSRGPGCPSGLDASLVPVFARPLKCTVGMHGVQFNLRIRARFNEVYTSPCMSNLILTPEPLSRKTNSLGACGVYRLEILQVNRYVALQTDLHGFSSIAKVCGGYGPPLPLREVVFTAKTDYLQAARTCQRCCFPERTIYNKTMMLLIVFATFE